jgi:hypothetical protein
MLVKAPIRKCPWKYKSVHNLFSHTRALTHAFLMFSRPESPTTAGDPEPSMVVKRMFFKASITHTLVLLPSRIDGNDYFFHDSTPRMAKRNFDPDGYFPVNNR